MFNTSWLCKARTLHQNRKYDCSLQENQRQTRLPMWWGRCRSFRNRPRDLKALRVSWPQKHVWRLPKGRAQVFDITRLQNKLTYGQNWEDWRFNFIAWTISSLQRNLRKVCLLNGKRDHRQLVYKIQTCKWGWIILQWFPVPIQWLKVPWLYWLPWKIKWGHIDGDKTRNWKNY